MDSEKKLDLSPYAWKCIREFKVPFFEQRDAVSAGLIKLVEKYPIALIAVYGSCVRGNVGPHSDVDLLVLLRNDYKVLGYNLLDLKDDIRDDAEQFKVNDIPLDIHISSVSNFVDMSHGREFKESFSDTNYIVWEDGVSVGRKYITKA